MKILVLAGGSDQIALIEELHKYGHEVLLLDYLDSPVAAKYADKHIKASTLDVDAVREIAEKEHVDLITTACTDQALLTVALVSEQLGLPCYIDYETALNVTNKAYMKKVLMDFGIPTAKYIIVDTIIGLKSQIEGFEFPLVVKPVDCNSSKGVKRVDDLEDLERAVADAINLSRTNRAVIEEFKRGEELSCDFYVKGNNAILLSVTASNKIKNRETFTILQSYYPAVSEEEATRISMIGQQVVEAFKLKDTPLFIQMIHDGTNSYVLEFSARMGGGSKYKLIERLSGVDIMSEYVKLILGKTVNIAPTKMVDYVTMNYIYCRPGTYDHVDGMAGLIEDGIVDCWFEYKAKGSEIEKAETSSDRPAGFMISASSPDEMSGKIAIADQQLKIMDDKGADMMLHGLYK